MPRQRIILLSIVPAVLAACVSTTDVRWERPGASDTTSARDASDCSAISWTEAERLHPYEPGGGPTLVTVDSGWARRQRDVENNRFGDANRFFGLCMQNRGYTRIETPRR